MRPGVARSGSPMPSEMTSIPARFFCCTLRSISAKRYGGIRPRRFAPATVLLIQIIEDTRQGIGLDLEPSDAPISAPPAQLPSRIAPIGARHRPRKLLQSQLAAEMCERVRIPDPAQHRRGGRHTVGKCLLRLGDEATVDLATASLPQSRFDDVEACRQSDADRLPPRWSPGTQAPQRGPRRLEDLQCANDAHRVVEIDARIRIDGEQPGSQRIDVDRL